MTYGIASPETREILAAAGLLRVVQHESRDDQEYVEVDIVFAGALEESFSVEPSWADQAVAALFESIAQTYPGERIEVSAYDRTCDDNAICLIEMSHDPNEAFQVVAAIVVEV